MNMQGSLKMSTFFHLQPYIGHWFHKLEVRVKKESPWDEKTTCAYYTGPSVTGANHALECSPSLKGRYVTLKIVQPN